MADIPHDTLCRWLYRIIDGQLTEQQFQGKCKLFKKTSRVRQQITEYVNSVRPNIQFYHWQDLVKKYHCFADTSWVEQLISWCGPNAKDKISPTIKTHILNRIQKLEEEEISAPPDQVITFTRIFYIFFQITKKNIFFYSSQ